MFLTPEERDAFAKVEQAIARIMGQQRVLFRNTSIYYHMHMSCSAYGNGEVVVSYEFGDGYNGNANAKGDNIEVVVGESLRRRGYRIDTSEERRVLSLAAPKNETNIVEATATAIDDDIPFEGVPANDSASEDDRRVGQARQDD